MKHKTAAPPRVVVVTRKTEYELLVERHGTHAQAQFFLKMREQSIEALLARHEQFVAEKRVVLAAIPKAWRRASVMRADLHRFLFEPEDIVVALGQDGLVANLAKYLDGQRVVGINPDPERNMGVLVPCRSADAEQLLLATAQDEVPVERRTMVEGLLDDGQRLLAVNELYLGHRTHQSARYVIRHGGAEELQSSSGLVVTTGTGATGWASSIHRARVTPVKMPAPIEPRLAFFVREAYPSRATGTTITDGDIGQDGELTVVSRMNDDGVIFGDGIEDDRLAFCWGSRARVRVARQVLNLVHGS